MKKLLPKLLVLLILMCSCNANKSFLHQRYTHYKHGKVKTLTENKSYAKKELKTSPATAEIVVVTPEPTKAEPAKKEPLRYTKNVVNRVILPVLSKGKEKDAGLVASNSKLPVTEVTKIKPVKLDQIQAKRGLLWGVIDGILAIIVLAAFVLLILWICWLYGPTYRR